MAQLGDKVTAIELAGMLNVDSKASAICKAVSINPFSERKPINHTKNGPLSDAEMRGMTTDHAQGIYYGLKAGVQNLTAANIHAADWSYVSRPTGTLSSPYRFSDFWRYEKDNRNPTLYGSGLADGQEPIWSNNTNITTMLVKNNVAGVVDIAKAIGNSMDYTKLYLCVLVGNKARAMLNKTTGTVTPIVYNGTEYSTFCFPDMTDIINTNDLPMTAKVSVFFVGSDGIATFRDSWVDLTTAINIGTKPVTLPKQVNLSITFRAAGKIYITAFSIELVVVKGVKSIVASFTNGQDWGQADAYRVLYNVTSPSGAKGSSVGLVEKYDFTGAATTSQSSFLNDVMTQAGFVQGSSAENYTIQADFQVRESANGSWKTTGYMQSITVSW